MRDYIVFRVAESFYALDVASVERIIHPLPVTQIPYAHPYVEGMVSYEKKVTKVVNFRKMTGLRSYEEELRRLFEGAKQGYDEWMRALERVLEGADALEISADPRVAAFGAWLEGFGSHDSETLGLLKRLRPLHGRLLEKGKEILWTLQSDPSAASALFDESFRILLPQARKLVEELVKRTDTIADQLQKMVIYRSKEELFAIKVDTITDMARIEEERVGHVEETGRGVPPFLEMEGVADIDGNLVNVIKTVILPVREAA